MGLILVGNLLSPKSQLDEMGKNKDKCHNSWLEKWEGKMLKTPSFITLKRWEELLFSSPFILVSRGLVLSRRSNANICFSDWGSGFSKINERSFSPIKSLKNCHVWVGKMLIIPRVGKMRGKFNNFVKDELTWKSTVKKNFHVFKKLKKLSLKSDALSSSATLFCQG